MALGSSLSHYGNSTVERASVHNDSVALSALRVVGGSLELDEDGGLTA